MAQGKLAGKKVAIIATDGFEQSELTEPKKALEQAGADVHVVAPKDGSIQGFQHFDKGETVKVDVSLGQARPGDYDALVIPGGLFNPDHLRTQEAAQAFARAFFEAGKPVGVICHGPQLLINADLVRGRTMTSVPTIAKDLQNAGAKWRDEEVVVDQGLVSSRKPDDLPAFCRKLVEEIGEGRHQGQAAAARH
jgi:protease I